jgi:small-conductance mechanosensitive channel
MTRLAGIDIDAPPEVVVPIFVAVLLVLSVVAARLVRSAAARWLSGPGGDRPDKTPPPSLGVPIGGAVLIGGLMLILPELALPGRLGRSLSAAFDILFVLACALGLSRIAISALTEYGARHPAIGPALGVTRGIIRIVVTVLAAIMALESIGVPVAPLLTTLGIGSLAVALALQETLANFFAGLHLLADRPVRPGDYIKIQDGGAEGFVEAIGWRSSRLRTTSNNIVVLPNQKLAQAILTNFHLPFASVAMTVSVPIAVDADPDAVEKLLEDELGRAVAQLADLQSGKPVVRLVDITDAGQLWHCSFDVKDVGAQKQAGHEVRKRLLTRLHRERIALAVKEKVFLLPEKNAPQA